jgi:hypothetical protein
MMVILKLTFIRWLEGSRHLSSQMMMMNKSFNAFTFKVIWFVLIFVVSGFVT